MKSIQLITTSKWQIHTDIFSILNILESEVMSRYWLLSDWQGNHFPKGYTESYETITVKGSELLSNIDKDFQLLWGVLSGSKQLFNPDDEIPYAETNKEIWEPYYTIQNKASDIEIIAWDSSYTLITSENEMVLQRLVEYYGENAAHYTDCLKKTNEYYRGQTVNEMLSQSGLDSLFYKYYENNEDKKAGEILYSLGLDKTNVDGIINQKNA